MRLSHIPVIFTLIGSLLIIAACDTREEKTEVIAPVEGSLLENGRVPAVTPEGAADLKKMMEGISFFKQYEEILSIIPEEDMEEMQENIEFLGEFNVINRPDHYEVTFPERTTIYPSSEEDFESIQFFHDITLRVRPTGDPSAYRVKFESSEKPFYAVINKDGEAREFISYSYNTSQEYEALWHNDFQMFVQMTGSMQDAVIDFTIPAEYRKDFDNIDGFKVNIGDIITEAMLQPDENNLWSGPYDASLDNIEITLPQNVGTATIVKLSSDQNMEKLNPVVYREFFANYDDIMENLYELESSNGDIDMMPMLKAYRSMIVDGFESNDVGLTLSSILVKLNKTPEMPDTEKVFGLEQAKFGGSLSVKDKDKASFNLAYTLKGLNVGLKQFEEELGGEAPQEMIPANVSFGMGATNLPLKTALDKTINIMQQAEEDGSNPETLFMQAQSEFIDLFAEADTKLKVNDTYVGNDIWLLLMNGVGNVNKNAMMKFDGETDIRFLWHGLPYANNGTKARES